MPLTVSENLSIREPALDSTYVVCTAHSCTDAIRDGTQKEDQATELAGMQLAPPVPCCLDLRALNPRRWCIMQTVLLAAVL